jgi:hypothetical protein
VIVLKHENAKVNVSDVEFIPGRRPDFVRMKINGHNVSYKIIRRYVNKGVGTWKKDCLYIEPNLPEDTEKATIVHEAVENFLMSKRKWNYENAHRWAVIWEHKMLRRLSK